MQKRLPAILRAILLPQFTEVQYAGLTLVIITFIKAFGWGFGAIALLASRTPLNDPNPNLFTPGGILVTALW